MDAGGAGALALLEGPFGGSSFPSLTGGDAGPSSAGSSSDTGVTFGNSFTVSGQGGYATANPTTTQQQGTTLQTLLLYGLAAVVAIKLLKR